MAAVARGNLYPFTGCMAMECEGWNVQPSALHPHSWPNKGDALGHGAVHVFKLRRMLELRAVHRLWRRPAPVIASVGPLHFSTSGMQTHLIAVPYDSALRGWRMGAGPERLLAGGLVDELRAAGHQVRAESVEEDSDAPAEIRTAFELNRTLAGRVREAQGADALPVVLAGNCLTAVGTLAGLGGTPAVLWFDAHGDFNTPETTASGFLDGMALAVVTGRCWANLARTVPGFRPVPERDVVLLGARELDAAERVLLDGSEIARLTPEQVPAELSPVLAKWSGREAYVHLDLDALDPAEGRANALAVRGGFTIDEACAALEQISRTLRVRAVALTAYDPVCDSEGRICRAASRLLGALLGAIAHPAVQQSLAGDEGRGIHSE